jgi:hypothetical protein
MVSESRRRRPSNALGHNSSIKALARDSDDDVARKRATDIHVECQAHLARFDGHASCGSKVDVCFTSKRLGISDVPATFRLAHDIHIA